MPRYTVTIPAPDDALFAEDIWLPEPGAHVQFCGEDATVVAAKRLSAAALEFTVDSDAAYASLIAVPAPS